MAFLRSSNPTWCVPGVCIWLCFLLSACFSSPQRPSTTPDGTASDSVSQDPFTPSDFVRIDAGSFMMGSASPDAFPDEQPVHRVTISRPYYIGKMEVTRGQWAAVMDSDPGSFGDESHPVDGISWNDIQYFLDTLNTLAACEGCYRLPTEAEWEYAARAGSEGAYSFGNDPERLIEYAWFSDNAEYTTHPVGQKMPNAWGLYDMHGNVYEWIQDRYGPYSSEPVIDPAGPDAGNTYILRGGSWTDGQKELRVTYRDYYAPDHRHNFFGFRLVRTGF